MSLINKISLVSMGYTFIPYTKPEHQTGIDIFAGYDYYVKNIGVKTNIVIREKNGIFKLCGFYSSRIKSLHDLEILVSILSDKK